MPNPFWNADEQRLRAGWRISFFILLFAALFALCAGLLLQAAKGFPGSMVPVTLAALLATSIAAYVLDRRHLADLGLGLDRDWWLDFGFGLLLGFGLMAGLFAIEYALGWVTVLETNVSTSEAGFGWALLLALWGFVQVGFYEELVFRGYLIRNLAEGFNGAWLGSRRALLLAWFLTSFCFGLAHAANPNATWIATLNISLAGLFLGLGYVLTERLAIPIGLHIAWNFAQGNLFGFPVSGTERVTSVLWTEQGGPALWTGGAFGPEAGLLGLLAMAVGVALTLLWIRYRYGPPRLAATLATWEPPLPVASWRPRAR